MAHAVRFHSGPASPVERMLRPFQRFASAEASGGIVLLLATVGALIWANSPWADSYHHLWESSIGFHLGQLDYSLSFHHFINDALMAVFFLLVGLEIKREMLVGELASLRAAALPFAAAAGGMVVPAAFYGLVNVGGEGAVGWGIPMATDIAFALGILALMGPRVPLGLKVFLTALAIVDDLGAVLVIAFFYTANLNVPALLAAGAVVAALFAMNRLGVRHVAVYGFVGVFLWFAVMASGVHATLAGVVLALAIPARTRIDTQEFLVTGRKILTEFDHAGIEGGDVLTNRGQQEAISDLEGICEAGQAPLRRLEHKLHRWTAFGIIPLFAFANAGVDVSGGMRESLQHPVSLGIFLGLVLGKPIGISVFSWVAVRTGAVELPQGVNWRALIGVSFLAGIGFTMSLFIATLAFGEASPLLEVAKIGILLASVVAAITGSLLLRPGSPPSGPAPSPTTRAAPAPR